MNMAVTDKAGTLAVLRGRIGETVGISPWFELTQDRVTAFGGITLDFDPHHIDPAQAANGPFGVPTAQGFLTLSLLTHFIATTPSTVNFRQHINYGLNRVRFIRPVPVGHHLRARFELAAAEPRGDEGALMTMTVTVESRELEAPVMVAEWLALLLL